MSGRIGDDSHKEVDEIAKNLAKIQSQYRFYTRGARIFVIGVAVAVGIALFLPETENVVNQDTTTETELDPVEMEWKTEYSSEQFSEIVIEQPKKNTSKPSIRREVVLLYSRPSAASDVVTGLRNISFLRIRERRGEWASVTTPDGIPVWVKAGYIERYGNGYAKIIADQVNARSLPSADNGDVMGVLDSLDIVRLIKIERDWYRVWSPRNFVAWVKISDLETE